MLYALHVEKPAAGRPCNTYLPSHSGLGAPASRAPGTNSHKTDPTPHRQEAGRWLHSVVVVVSEGTNRSHTSDTPRHKRRLAFRLLFRYAVHFPVHRIGHKPWHLDLRTAQHASTPFKPLR